MLENIFSTISSFFKRTVENSELPFVACCAISLSCAIWFAGKKYIEYRLLPPGPCGMPGLGYLPWMSTGAPHLWYRDLSVRYGDLTSIRLGSTLVVCVGSSALLKDLFTRKSSTGRPQTPLNQLMNGLGVITSQGELWREQRQFLLHCFRSIGINSWNDYGFENYILLEVTELIISLKQSAGQLINPIDHAGRHMHNVICQLMMSFRFTENNAEFRNFSESLSESFRLYGLIHYGEYVPYYMYLPGKRSVLKQIKRNLEEVSEFHRRHIEARRLRRRPNENQEPSDLLDYYLDVIEGKSHTNKDIFEGVKPEEQLVQVMNDLFSAGMETARTSLMWLLVMMIREPEIAANVRRCIGERVAFGDEVRLCHRKDLAYVEAVILETLRRTYVVPLGTTHVNTEDWSVRGYKIPAGSHIVPLINKINMDPNEFPEPTRFMPERYLINGRLKVPDNFIGLGVGRRICLGEKLAKMELFLFFANIMHNFNLSIPEGEPIPALDDGIFGTTHAPQPYKIVFTPRNHPHY